MPIREPHYAQFKFKVALEAAKDSKTLNELASCKLPQRGVNKTLNMRKIVSDSSVGACFYPYDQDWALLGLPDNSIEVVGTEESEDGLVYTLESECDLHPALGEQEANISAVLPDWQRRYWFVTRSGTVATVHPDNGRIETIQLPGEELQDSFAVGEDADSLLP